MTINIINHHILNGNVTNRKLKLLSAARHDGRCGPSPQFLFESNLVHFNLCREGKTSGRSSI